MIKTLDPPATGVDTIDQLRAIGREFHGRSWSLGTSSNYSAVTSRAPLELLITPEVQEQAKQEAMQNQTQQALLSQAGQLAKAPLMDPSVNPNIAQAIGQPQAATAAGPTDGGQPGAPAGP